MYRPPEADHQNVAMQIQTPTVINVLGVNKKTWTDGDRLFASFKSYGGTERVIDGVYVIEDTANVVTRYHPDITSGCRLKRLDDNAYFEIIGEPEDIEMRHFWMKFKVRRLKGGA